MRVIVDLFRKQGGRLGGALETQDGQHNAFPSTLDLLRVLEGLDLSRPLADSAAELGFDSDEEEAHG